MSYPECTNRTDASVLCLMDAAEERQAERAASTGLLRTSSDSAPAVPSKRSPPTSSSSHEPARIITPEDFEQVGGLFVEQL